MEAFTIVDGIVLAVIVVSAVLAYSRGLLREVLAILGWIAAAFAAFVFAPTIEPLVREIPVLSDILGGSCELGMLAAFAAVFAVALVLVSFFTPLLSGAVQNSAVGPVDQGLGLLFGVARGVLLVVIALVVYDRVLGGEGFAQVDTSRAYEIFDGMQDELAQTLPSDAPGWIARQYEQLTATCQ